MAFIFVKMLLALLLVANVCMCTKQDPNRIAVRVVRQTDTLKDKSRALVDSGVGTLDGGRNKRSLSPSDRTESVTTMNNLRRTIGASNMPYMVYSNYQEIYATMWTEDCNYYKPVTPTINTYYLKHVTSNLPVSSILAEGFKSYSRQFSSVYLKSFGCDQRKCSSLTKDGANFTDADLTLCLFEAETCNYGCPSLPPFNDSVIQYALGEACTTCLSGSYWCDGGLCRDDCSSKISTCSCFSGCTKCKDWNRGSCTCPSQANASAVTLNCYNKGEMAFKAEVSMAIIIVSTLLLFGLQ